MTFYGSLASITFTSSLPLIPQQPSESVSLILSCEDSSTTVAIIAYHTPESYNYIAYSTARAANPLTVSLLISAMLKGDA